jgi:putative transposase
MASAVGLRGAAPPQGPARAIGDAKSDEDLTQIPEALWHIARRRLEVLSPLVRMKRRTRVDVQQAAEQLECSCSWLYALLKRLATDARVTSLLPHRPGPRCGRFKLAVQCEDVVRTAIDDFYLTRQQPSVSALMIEIRRRCRLLALVPPSRRAVQRRIDARPAAEVVRQRRGDKAARDRFGPAVGSLTVSRPLQLVQVDHTLVDVIVVDSVTRQPIQRPWLTLAIDVCTRCVLGFHLALEAPSATSVALCIAHAILPKDGWLSERGVSGEWAAAGIPERLHLDNGKDFHSEALRRGCEQYGIGLQYRPVRTPHYGGHIERLIGSVMGKVHLLPGTTFSNIAARGTADPEQTASLTLQELERWLATAIVGVYHQAVHRGLGTTPFSAWRRSICEVYASDGRAMTQVPDPRRLLIDFLPYERRLVRREGIVLYSIQYWSEILTTWIGEPEKMIVRYDPRNLSRIHLLAPDGCYQEIPYRELYRPPISLWEHRAALKHLRMTGCGAVDESALFSAIDSMRRITDRASSETKSVRRQRERARHWGSEVPSPTLRKPSIATLPETAAQNEDVFSSVEEWA